MFKETIKDTGGSVNQPGNGVNQTLYSVLSDITKTCANLFGNITVSLFSIH